jgi:L-alanine-DL-glutamate epimerase-like enolase superfamily enzyme
MTSIERLEVRRERLPLTQPYTIARETFVDVELLFVRLSAGGKIGTGSASPAPEVTGETPDHCEQALLEMAEELTGTDSEAIEGVAKHCAERWPAAPAARAAVDMALWDLLGRRRGVPVVELLGRAHDALPTSITLGIQSTEEALAAAREYVGRGFRALKVKLGRDVEDDIERLWRLREAVGPSIALRTDPNAGYDSETLRRYLEGTRELSIEFCEQPVERGRDGEISAAIAGLDGTPSFAADESLHRLEDVDTLDLRPYAIWNLKLMKCGGITPARALSHRAGERGIALMWGCNDESRVSIAAALHVAFSSPATRYLDLDGSFDLARDCAQGGFVLEEGLLRTVDAPGLGLVWDG